MSSKRTDDVGTNHPTSVSVKGKNGKYILANTMHFRQITRQRLKKVQIRLKWRINIRICVKKYTDYQPIIILDSYKRCNYIVYQPCDITRYGIWEMHWLDWNGADVVLLLYVSCFRKPFWRLLASLNYYLM